MVQFKSWFTEIENWVCIENLCIFKAYSQMYMVGYGGGIILTIIIISWTDVTHLVFRLEYKI